MEHIPLPHGAYVDLAERAPYIAERYDNGSFLDYPSRSRFIQTHKVYMEKGVPVLVMYQANREISADLDVFLQTWLFFGLLYEVFGDAAPADDFIDRASDLPYPMLTTAKLPQVLDRWMAGYKTGHQESNDRLRHLGHCLRRANTMIHRTVNWSDSTDKTVLFAIVALAETLDDAISLLCPDEEGDGLFSNNWAEFERYFDTTASMITNGWCPSLLNRKLSTRFNGFLSNYYMGKMSQPGCTDHTQCSSTACAVQSSGTYNQVFKHRCSNQNCELVQVDVEAVKEILGCGRIALLDVSPAEDDDILSIRVLSSDDCASYVAISHVWTDGLGNPNANALPTCQVIYVAECLQDLQAKSGVGKFCLWLDTLCCPVASNYHRDICLKQMDHIYRNASHVLVLDPPLSALRKSELSTLELCARIMLSGWTKRLWTLQEGLLPENILVQLQDEAVDLDDVMEDVRSQAWTSFASVSVTMPFGKALWRIRAMMPMARRGRGQTDELLRVISILEGRSVSVPSDEPLCLCTCMGIRQDSVVNALPKDRMPVFWESMDRAEKTIPKSIIFFYGERLSNKGFRWSPASLLDTTLFHGLGVTPGTAQGTLSDRGLLLAYAGCEVKLNNKLSPLDRKRYDEILQEPGGRKTGTNVFRHAEHGWFMLYNNYEVPLHLQHFILDIIRKDGAPKALIMNRTLDTITLTTTAACCIGTIVEESQGTNFYRSIAAGTLVRNSEWQQLLLETAWRIVHDSNIASQLLPSLKDPSERLREPVESYLADFPNEAVVTLLKLCHDAAASQEFAETINWEGESAIADRLVSAICFIIGEQYGEITRTWPDSQVWCVD